jgi:hypothetical protein
MGILLSATGINQDRLMRYDPATGTPHPYPSHAGQYRKYHRDVAFIYNPWTGKMRDAHDIGSDVRGHLIVPPDERTEK